MKKLYKNLKFGEKGLIPSIIQDAKTKKVLTLCYMNKAALSRSFRSGFVYVFRRSKGKLMKKGQSSGCVQKIKKVFIDCEGKSMLFVIDQVKAACHEGYFTCYFRRIDNRKNIRISDFRVFDPELVYKK
ncbi:MAG: phosphoribosyl-AMP cyclohydrolase [Candidatus Omnitrophota bacterium]